MRGLSGDSPLKTMAKSFAAAAILLALAACQATRPPSAGAAFAGPAVAGELAEPRNREASGFAISRRTPDLLWTHEDSDGATKLYALDLHGATRGVVRIEGVENIDWEDIASFEWQGRAWLCVADVGDNNARRPFILLHFVEEPDPAQLTSGRELVARPSFTLQVTYEDGARDCESLAVDPREGFVYLLSKREAAPRLYRVPLAAASGTAVARRVGDVAHFPQPNAAQRLLKIPTGLYRGSPCAMDFAADGSAAVIVTYGDVCYFPRAAGESWATALAREPRLLAPHALPQTEAVAFSQDAKSIYVCSEDSPRLLRYDRQ